ALGSRLKSERLRMRLSSAGCANLDLMHLPEKCPTFPEAKIEDIRLRYLASAGNLLVCLEPGPPLDLCRRFDPELRRTVLVGAAASQVNRGGDDLLPASVLCGPDAASSLEERFAKLCRDRAPQWLASLEKLELRLSKSSQEAREIEQKEHAGEVLTKARSAGFSFGRALQEVIGGSPGCSAGALTLEEELVEFASAAARGHCGAGDFLLGKDAASSAADLFVLFGGVEGYAKYLRDQVKISGADVALNGGAAWRRLLAELEVAVRLAHPPEESIKSIAQAAICAGGDRPDLVNWGNLLPLKVTPSSSSSFVDIYHKLLFASEMSVDVVSAVDLINRQAVLKSSHRFGWHEDRGTVHRMVQVTASNKRQTARLPLDCRLSIAFEPILRRVRYVAARVIWLLRHQKLAVSEWMSFLAEGPGARINSPLFSQHLGVLRSSPVVRDLVFGAFDDAVGAVGEQLLKNLTGTLTAACINPEIMLRRGSLVRV
ncbi:GIP, partial [Symbiodinium sp. CCMP2456]